MWGTPGSLVAARAMLERTGDERWRDAWNESADALLARRDRDGLWTQRLHGERYRGLCTAHGLVGNVQALTPLLDEGRRSALEREANAVLSRSAFVEDGARRLALCRRERLAASDGQIRVQWCVGAACIVTAAADYLDEDLLLVGAELTWRVGPPALDKGAGICRGTAGNGHALLAASRPHRLSRPRRLVVGRARASVRQGFVKLAPGGRACIRAESVSRRWICY